MLEAIRVAGGLKATGDRQATGRVVVIPKNLEKCSMILNCKEQNHASGVEPKGFCAWKRYVTVWFLKTSSRGGGCASQMFQVLFVVCWPVCRQMVLFIWMTFFWSDDLRCNEVRVPSHKNCVG